MNWAVHVSRRRRDALAVILAGLLVLCGCAVVPHETGDAEVSKVAVQSAEAEEILGRYRAVRSIAVELLDPKPLSTVEGPAVLAIDSGSFEVSQRLAKKHVGDSNNLQILQVWSPELKKYPLWFVVQVADDARDVIKVQVFGRESAASRWLLMASPEILQSTTLPDLERGDDDTVVAVTLKAGEGVAGPAKKAVASYVAALNDPGSAAAELVAQDGFMRQMRAGATAAKTLKGVKFKRSWVDKGIDYALRTEDGGVLVFATLMRQDNYSVKEGLAVRWPEGSPQQAFLGQTFLGAGISTSGTLTFTHQVLMYVPAAGQGKPRVLGQFGGVVDAVGGV